MTPGQQFLGTLIFFAIVLIALAVTEWRARPKRNRRIVPRMYVKARPKPDSRSSIEQFTRMISKE